MSTSVRPIYSRIEIAERMSADDFFRDAPEDRKAELIDGVMIVPSPPFTIHERVQRFLLLLIQSYAEERDLGETFGSRTAVELAPQHVPEPDLLFVSKARLGIVQEKGVIGAPDFVIEILSASTSHYDRGAKFRAYERAGVAELWLIDPYGPDGTQFFQARGGHFVEIFPSEYIVRAEAIPGFWIDVRWLWPQASFIPVRQALQIVLASPT
jgi:Uma2 family endonuclease